MRLDDNKAGRVDRKLWKSWCLCASWQNEVMVVIVDESHGGWWPWWMAGWKTHSGWWPWWIVKMEDAWWVVAMVDGGHSRWSSKKSHGDHGGWEDGKTHSGWWS